MLYWVMRCTNIFILLKSSHLWDDKRQRNKNGIDIKWQNNIRKKKMQLILEEQISVSKRILKECLLEFLLSSLTVN